MPDFDNLDASRAAITANVNRFTGREPAPTPVITNTETTVASTRWTASAINWGEAVFAPPPIDNAQIFRSNTWEPAPPPPAPEPEDTRTKEIEFEGISLTVPIWATHATQEHDGSITVWENEPIDWSIANKYVHSYAGQRKKVVMSAEVFPRMKVEIA